MFERLLTSFQNILKIPELRTRILFTVGMLIVYRIGAHIPTPGINGEALSEFLQKEGGALLGRQALEQDEEGERQGVRRLGRPRGIYCGIGQCFDCYVRVNGGPVVRACVTTAAEGDEVSRG